jgi:hypothetical protein
VLPPELLPEPLPEPELLLDPPELDELPPSLLPPSATSAVAPPHAAIATIAAPTTTTAPSFRCMRYLTMACTYATPMPTAPRAFSRGSGGADCAAPVTAIMLRLRRPRLRPARKRPLLE